MMYLYDKFFSEYGHTVSQVLLTGDAVEHEERRQNVHNTFQRLLELEAPLELEAYPDRGGVLLFVRSLAPRQVWHPFLELDALLAAARDLGPLCAAAEVVWFGGLCCLTLPAEARQARRRLSGFASPPEDAAAWEALALGGGSVRLSGRALALLLDDSRERSV